MENKSIQKITIVCFAIIAVWNVVDLFGYFSFQALLTVIGSILVVVALLTKNTVFSTVGFGLMILQGLTDITAIFKGWMTFPIFLLWVLMLVRDVLLMIVSIKPKSAKTLGTVAAGIVAVRFVVLIIRNLIAGFRLLPQTILWGILMIVSSILFGLTCDGFANSISVIKAPVYVRENAVAQNTLQISNTDKLLRLKGFLDQGVISQEEFDHKKKELLNF